MQRLSKLLLVASETLGNVASAGSGFNWRNRHALSDSEDYQLPLDSVNWSANPPITVRDDHIRGSNVQRMIWLVSLYVLPFSAHRNAIGRPVWEAIKLSTLLADTSSRVPPFSLSYINTRTLRRHIIKETVTSASGPSTVTHLEKSVHLISI